MDVTVVDGVVKIFHDSRNNYDSRKIKVELAKVGQQISRRRIRHIMIKMVWYLKQYKVHKSTCNNAKVKNIVNREFDREKPLDVVVSDLTYVNAAGKWNYIYLLLDLYNREIIGYATGKNKDAKLVYKAFSRIQGKLDKIHIFHSDRGNEFKNRIIDDVLKAFGIKRSLSAVRMIMQ